MAATQTHEGPQQDRQPNARMKGEDFGIALALGAQVLFSILSYFSKYHRQVLSKEIVGDHGPIHDTGIGQYHVAKIIP